MKTSALLTIDIGTSSIRVSLFEENMRPLGAKSYRVITRDQVDMERYWEIILHLMEALLEENKTIEVRAIAVSSLLGWVPVDEQGNPLCEGMTYLDHKPKQLEEFRNHFDAHQFYQITGRMLNDELGGLKLKYLQQEQPEVYQKTKYFLTLKDFINMKLTGKAFTDITYAGYYMLFDVESLVWSEEIISSLGVNGSKLPPLAYGSERIGYVKPEWCVRLGFAKNVAVAAGGPDGSVGVLGAGGLQKGTAVNISGTTDVMFCLSDRLIFDGDMRVVINPYMIPGLWLVGGPMALYGGTIHWMMKSIMGESYSFEQMEEACKRLPPGSEGVLAIPALSGERTPYWQPLVRGSVVGLGQNHGPEHIFRAIMEANAYTLRYLLDILKEEKVQPETVRVIGGGAANLIWLQIKASVLDTPMVLPQCEEATSRGCAILAAMAAGCWNRQKDILQEKRTIRPDKTVAEYQNLYRNYLKFHQWITQFYVEH